MGRLYQDLLGGALRKTFPLWQALGVHITPNHFYQPIPDTRRIDDAVWVRRLELEGVEMRIEEQLALLALFERRFSAEYEQFPRRPARGAPGYYLENLLFSGVDAQVLYCMVRHVKPRRVIEIGAGFSTLVFSRALARNRSEDDGRACDFTSVDPDAPHLVTDDLAELSRLVRSPVQALPLREFEALGDGDILFVDSSHVLATGSDVHYLILRVLPRLRPGVLVHFHDIFLPAEYPQEWVLKRFRFWNEQYALHAFLAFNDVFRVVWAGHFLHLTQPDALRRAFGGYRSAGVVRGRPSVGCSFWIRRVG